MNDLLFVKIFIDFFKCSRGYLVRYRYFKSENSESFGSLGWIGLDFFWIIASGYFGKCNSWIIWSWYLFFFYEIEIGDAIEFLLFLNLLNNVMVVGDLVIKIDMI